MVSDSRRAFGVSVATARRYYASARAELQEALDREQNQKRALGLVLLPLSIDQLIASDSTSGHVTAETMGRIWKTLDRAMAADVKAGKLRDDGTDVERYMGSPDATPHLPRPNIGARVLRAFGPRGLSALTHIGAVAVSAGVTYAFMRPKTHTDATADVAVLASSRIARPVSPPGPAPSDTAAPGTLRGSGAVEESELRADAGAPELRADAGASPAERDDIGEEKALFDRGKTAYKGGFYQEAIRVFQDQARRYPQGQYAGVRERLLILSLIGASRKPEARQRIEQLRRTTLESPVVKELEAALRAAN